MQEKPTKVIDRCEHVTTILDDILISCQSTATLESAHQLILALTSNPKFSGVIDTTEILQGVLEGIGFGGLWRSSTFRTTNEQDRQCTALTDRLIEVSPSKKILGDLLSLTACYSLLLHSDWLRCFGIVLCVCANES
jgi:hypothetical protein